MKRYRHAHPLTKTAQGLLLDLDADTESQTWRDLSEVLNNATEAAKDIEEDRDAAEERVERLRAVLSWVAIHSRHSVFNPSKLAAEALAADDAARGEG